MVGAAATFFKSLEEQNPKNAFAHFGLGQILLAKGEYDSAIPEFQRALALDPQLRGAVFSLGQAQLGAQHYSDAQATFESILKQDANDKRAQAGLDYARGSRINSTAA
jgi:tetratricopeptide (TPR) repeat protein